jgi:hypothetical protein
MNSTAAPGTAVNVARGDHVHPIDTSRASTDAATASAAGLMSATDKVKLDGIGYRYLATNYWDAMSDKTQDEWFIKLNSLIPTAGDKLKVSGCIKTSNGNSVASFIERMSATWIQINAFPLYSSDKFVLINCVQDNATVATEAFYICW